MDWLSPLDSQSSPVQADSDWTGSEIHQLSGFWIGLDPEMCNVYPLFRDLRQFLLILTQTSEVLPSNLQLYTSSFVFTCRFYKVFGRYLLCCVRIGLDWIHNLGHQLDWTGLGSVARGFGLDWIVSIRSIPYSGSHQPPPPPHSHYKTGSDGGWAPKARSRSQTIDGNPS